LDDALSIDPKARCNVTLARHCSCLDRTPDAVLLHDDSIVAGKHTQRFEVQACPSQPLTQELMPVT
jgi:hypothetical protein